ncbi:MAG: tripartite tricarboxylate transporter TctB family protein [Alphaproteobacteria bacterium]
MRRRNILAALVLLALGVGYGVFTSQLPVRSLPDTPGPPFFPWINTVVILALSAALLVQGLVGTGGPAPAQVQGRWRAGWALGVFVVYLAILPGLGFILATAPFFAALMLLFGETRTLRVAAGAIIATALLYFLFRHGFNVFLPTGVLKGIVP